MKVSNLQSNASQRLPIHTKLGILCLSVVFGTASIAKLQGFNNFKSTIAGSLLVPQSMTYFVSVLIVTLEIALTLGLFIPALRRSSLQLFAGMISIFMAYSAWRGIQHIPLPCHCFGALFTMTPLQAFFLNLGLLSLVAYLLACLEPRRASFAKLKASTV